MIINKKILLYSLLAGLAFGASRSWPMGDDQRLLHHLIPLTYTNQGGLWNPTVNPEAARACAKAFCVYQDAKIQLFNSLPTAPKGSPQHHLKQQKVRQAKKMKWAAQKVLQAYQNTTPTAPSTATEDQTPVSE